MPFDHHVHVSSRYHRYLNHAEYVPVDNRKFLTSERDPRYTRYAAIRSILDYSIKKHSPKIVKELIDN